MSIALLDVNMLIAIAWPSHVHHLFARKWFIENSQEGWATCPITESGFIRISSNIRINADAVRPVKAKEVLSEITASKAHHFWKDEIPFESPEIPFSFLTGHRQVTDAYLLGLAIHNQGVLVTLDQGIGHLLAKNSPHRTSLCILKG